MSIDKNDPKYLQFCQFMADEMNLDAMKYLLPANMTAERVANIPEAKSAYIATLNISNVISLSVHGTHKV